MMMVDGVRVLEGESELGPHSNELFTYTRASPAMGSAVRVYAEALNPQTGVTYTDAMLVPPFPPEVWLSFASLSSFASSLTSTSSSASSSFTLAYYLSTLGVASGGSEQPVAGASVISPVDLGLTMSLTLIGILIFIELTDKRSLRSLLSELRLTA